MAQKIVSFEVAKALKEAGYPQDYNNTLYSEDGHIHINITYEYRLYVKEHKLGYDAPTYTDVWLWLWREKKIKIEIFTLSHGLIVCPLCADVPLAEYSDPEEAICEAINYLISNNLIK